MKVALIGRGFGANAMAPAYEANGFAVEVVPSRDAAAVATLNADPLIANETQPAATVRALWQADKQLKASLLSGLAFTLFYTIMGIPFAWLADRGSRRNLIVVSMTFWSVMTAACGMASSFLTLFLARIGVGVGEAGLSPAAY